MRQHHDDDVKLHRVRGYLPWFSTDTSFAAAIAINTFVLPVLVLMVTGSASSAGMVSAVGNATAGITSLFGGWLQDTVNKRTLIVWSSFAGIVLFAAGVALLATSRFNFATAATLAFLLGFRAGLSGTVTNVMLRSFIPPTLLPKAISVGQARDSVVEFVGAPVGGFLLDLGKVVPFLTNVVLNCLALLSALLLPKRAFDPVEVSSQTAERRPTLRGLTAGFKFVRQSRLLRVISTSGNFAFAIFNAALMVTTLSIVRADGNPVVAGFLNSGVAVGVFIGAVIAPKLTARFRGGPLVLLAYIVPLISLALLLPSVSSYVKIALLAPSMVLLPTGSAVMGSIQMLVLPKHMLGRYFAAVGVIELVFSAVSTAAVSAVYEQFGYRIAMSVCLVLMLLSVLHLALASQVRRIPTSADYEEYAADNLTT